jgi:fucose 4-O-acetylase-like acetyltransferase
MFINTVNKNNYVSIAKGIAIVLMVIGHAGCPALLHDTIYSFHMPFFFIVSGMFFVPPIDRGFMKQFIKRRIKGLYIPFH